MESGSLIMQCRACMYPLRFIVCLWLVVPRAWPAPSPRTSSATYANTAAGVSYTGSGACQTCHADVHESFMKTAMGRSIQPAESEEVQALIPAHVKFYSPELKRYFEIYREGKDVYQSESALGPNGQPIFKETQKIDYVVGAGDVGYNFLLKEGDFLFEAPVAYYEQTQNWGLSPGYEKGDDGFTRPVLAECIYCHSGRPKPVMHSEGRFQNPAFEELAVGCENCHGPGELHVKQRSTGSRPAGKLDSTIVNPAHLPARLADNICMRCHAGGSARVLKPGKDYSDFRPGTALNDTVSIFDIPLTPGDADKAPLLNQYSQMVLSKCYRASNGQLHCISCHDPHRQPSGAQAVEFYRNRCLACHTEKSCRLPLSARLKEDPPNNCFGCHMPRNTLQVVAHAALSNHRVLARPDEPLPQEAFHQALPASPDLVWVDPPPGRVAPSPQPLTLLKAYEQLVGAGHPEYRDAYLRTLALAKKTNPEDPSVLAGLSVQAQLENNASSRAKAIDYLSRAIAGGENSTSRYLMLAKLYLQDGQGGEAVDTLQKAIRENPQNPALCQALGYVYLSMGRNLQAEGVLKHELQMAPHDDATRELLRRAFPSSSP